MAKKIKWDEVKHLYPNVQTENGKPVLKKCKTEKPPYPAIYHPEIVKNFHSDLFQYEEFYMQEINIAFGFPHELLWLLNNYFDLFDLIKNKYAHELKPASNKTRQRQA